ncbi:hypothetical protein [Streptomyces sp. XY332]|uniref:hypothetical protein n=1 Tax=Streptomyces sp. XY332 TaxID=1415561 RepID=UPI001F18C1E4|nr:hypothetical protein [Streptomyces sp. XY332]
MVWPLVQAAALKPSDYPSDNMTDTWPRILESAARAGKLRRLVQIVAEDARSSGYSIFRDLLATAPAQTGDPYRVNLLGQRRAFFDRARLRDHLRELTSDHGSRVLILTGGAGCGKSYSWYLLSYVLERLGSGPYPVDFQRWVGPKAKPLDVMRELADQLDWPMRTTEVEEPEDTQTRNLLGWFRGKVRQYPGNLWIFFDGVNEERLTPAAMRLVKGIAIVAERHESGTNLRVVLADFNEPLLADVDPYVLREPIGPIERPELAAFFKNVADAAGQPIDDDAANVLVEDLFSQGPLPLAELACNAAKLARNAFNLPEAFSG